MQGSGERKCAAFAVAVSACAVLFAQARPAVPELVSGPRPLVKVVDLLQARFGKIVTYEEPLILNPDDLQLYAPATSEWSTGPKTRNFPMRSMPACSGGRNWTRGQSAGSFRHTIIKTSECISVPNRRRSDFTSSEWKLATAPGGTPKRPRY